MTVTLETRIVFALALVAWMTFHHGALGQSTGSGQQVRVTVNTTVGEIIGVEEDILLPDGTQGTVSVFLGIPYALPPVGELRFSKPRPHPPFTQPFPAVAFGPGCPQRQTVGAMSEDCLRLNVYAPANRNQSPLPVIVWIHGGAFVSGEGRQLPMENFVSLSEVVAVTFNFRIGLLGFLSTDDAQAAGNWGLWDQRLALQWVSNNIASFGGDPSRVTLAGSTSGAYGVVYQAMFGPNQGLFHRVLLESGTPLSTSGFRLKGLPYALQVAEEADCPQPLTSSSIISCLRRLDYKALLASNVTSSEPFVLTWTPVVDRDFILTSPLDAFTWPPARHSLAAFRSRDALFGTTSSDGSVLVDVFLRPVAARKEEVLTAGMTQPFFEEVVGLIGGTAGVKRLGGEEKVTTLAMLQEYTDWENQEDPAARARAVVQLLTGGG